MPVRVTSFDENYENETSQLMTLGATLAIKGELNSPSFEAFYDKEWKSFYIVNASKDVKIEVSVQIIADHVRVYDICREIENALKNHECVVRVNAQELNR